MDAADGIATNIEMLFESGRYAILAQHLEEKTLRLGRETGETDALLYSAAAQMCRACAEVQSERHQQERRLEELGENEVQLRSRLQQMLLLLAEIKRKSAVSTGSSDLPKPEPEPPAAKRPLHRWLKWFARDGGRKMGEVLTADTNVTEIEAMAAKPLPVPEPQRLVQPFNEMSLTIYCLGAFRVYQNEQAIESWKSNKGVLILKYLITFNGKPISKEQLMDLFWPDADFESARRNLHQAVYSLRQALRSNQPTVEHIRYEHDSYSLNPDMATWTDFEAFERHTKRGRFLEANGQTEAALIEFGVAEGLYQGNFLEENPYDDWAARKREYLQNQYLRIALRLIGSYREKREFPAAIALCHRVLLLDTTYEPAHRQLMACFLAQGQRHLAVRQYQTCRHVLKEELNLEPDAETAALYQKIRQSTRL